MHSQFQCNNQQIFFASLSISCQVLHLLKKKYPAILSRCRITRWYIKKYL
nr:MAG TPA: hypothetical protein [Caudoviricetes sp.]